jgi:Domain of unknown function (DUF5655)
MKNAALAPKERPTVKMHFLNRSPAVRQIYDRILHVSRRFGPIKEDPKKTCIHLVNRSAYAGIQNRRESMILTLKSAADIDDKRIFRRLQASANRWYLEIKLQSSEDVDDELISWLEASYHISG